MIQALITLGLGWLAYTLATDEDEQAAWSPEREAWNRQRGEWGREWRERQ
jgi:hypothetical protein